MGEREEVEGRDGSFKYLTRMGQELLVEALIL